MFQNPANPAELVSTLSDVDAQDFQRKNPTWNVIHTSNVIHTADADPFCSYLGGAATDCAHIAAAAVFGVLSWDASLKAFLEREAARDSGLPSAGALISRTLALLSHAWKPTTRADAFDDAGATARERPRSGGVRASALPGTLRPEFSGFVAPRHRVRRLAGALGGRRRRPPRARHPRARDRGVPRALPRLATGPDGGVRRARALRACARRGGGQANGKIFIARDPHRFGEVPVPRNARRASGRDAERSNASRRAGASGRRRASRPRPRRARAL